MLSCYVEAGHQTSDDFERHLLRVADYLWCVYIR